MTYELKFHPLAELELKNLDGSVRLLVLKQLKKISINPQLGEELGNKHGFDLTGLRKMYVDNKKIRIVYSFNQNEIIVKIIAIGKRNDLDVYKNSNDKIIPKN